MMTANDARKLLADAQTAIKSDDAIAAAALLGCWHRAIQKAARAGRESVTEGEIDRPRMPISSAARAAAREQLRADGFTVEAISPGLNENEVRVSWPGDHRPST